MMARASAGSASPDTLLRLSKDSSHVLVIIEPPIDHVQIQGNEVGKECHDVKKDVLDALNDSMFQRLAQKSRRKLLYLPSWITRSGKINGGSIVLGMGCISQYSSYCSKSILKFQDQGPVSVMVRPVERSESGATTTVTGCVPHAFLGYDHNWDGTGVTFPTCMRMSSLFPRWPLIIGHSGKMRQASDQEIFHLRFSHLATHPMGRIRTWILGPDW